MGFGISDEVLEKIIMEPWLAPYRDGSVITKPSSYMRFNKPKEITFIQPSQIKASSTKTSSVKKSNVVTTMNSIEKESANILFIKAITKEINHIYSSGIYSRLRSGELKQCFTNLKEYFELICKELKIDIYSERKRKQDKKAIDYLFQGISEQIFFVITHNDLSRKSLSNVITDTVNLMNEWGFNKSGETIEKKLFFSYYEERFDLSKNEFHCCPYCGAVLYKGFHNCPNCLRIAIKGGIYET